MNEFNIEKLKQKFECHDENYVIQFKLGTGNLPVVEIKNKQASAVVSLQGAHLLSWIPEGADEVIWLSEDAVFVKGKSVRGGIPICWPWFGAHESKATYPAHGFARTSVWDVMNVQQLASGETQIIFKLETQGLNEGTQKMWPQPTVLEYTITVGRTLTLDLVTFNHSERAITIGQALHTYFNVDDIGHTVVYGLEGKDYLNKPDNFKRKTQIEPITIKEEVDRIYLGTDDDIIIDDAKRKISIKKQGSQSTIVWNPWLTVAEKMGDLGSNGYLKMLCIESANAAEDTITITAGGSHKLQVIYKVESVS